MGQDGTPEQGVQAEFRQRGEQAGVRLGEILVRQKAAAEADVLRALAIQLELEDEQLQEWRNRMSQLRQKAAPEKKTDEAEAEPKAETPKPETKAKGKPKKKSASPDQ